MPPLIETHIPLPPKPRKGRKSLYPFAGMAVGDSFAVPSGSRVAAASSAAAYFVSRNPGAAFTRRGEAAGQTRFWRTS